jgi:hypothetical protein
MATTTVKSSGGDYSSLSAWEAGTQGTLTEIATAEVYGMSDTTACTIAGSTVTSSFYRRVVPASGAEAQMPPNTSGTAYDLNGSGGTRLTVDEQYARIGAIQVRNTGTAANSEGVFVGASNALFERTYASSAVGGNVGHAYYLSGPSGVIFRNCVGAVPSTSHVDSAAWSHDVATYTCQNCTAIGGSGGYGFRVWTNASVLTNCLASMNGGGTAFYSSSGTWHASTNYNAASDATAPGANSRNSQTFTFVNAASYDWHLASTDAGAKDYGTDLSGTFTTDFDGVTRSGSWDIGADEYVAAGGGSTTAIDTDGTSTVNGSGASLASTNADVDGAATVNSAGASIAATNADLDGSATVNSAGSSLASTNLGADGTSTATMVGASVSEGFGDLSSDGTSTATAEGASLAAADMESDGTAGGTLVGDGGAAAEEETPTAIASGGGGWDERAARMRRKKRKQEAMAVSHEKRDMDDMELIIRAVRITLEAA